MSAQDGQELTHNRFARVPETRHSQLDDPFPFSLA